MLFGIKPRAASNLAKHGIRFADAALALEDLNALTIADTDHGELRFKTLAMDTSTNVLLIVHAEQDARITRIISARRADKREQRYYFGGGFHE